ncbi:unnamed protein product, partial [Urochloa humidicola]
AALASPLAAASKRTVAQAGGPASASRHPRARRRCVAGPPAPAPHEHAPTTGCATPHPAGAAARLFLGGRGEARGQGGDRR